MSGAYVYPDDRKAHVHRRRFVYTGEWAWCAGKPGGVYLCGDGLHFDTWSDAIVYATTLTP